MQPNVKHQKYFIAVLLLSLPACESNKAAHYDKLCDIYSSIVEQPISTDDKEGLLAESISKELPDFYKSNYINVLTLPLAERYAIMKRIAEEVSGEPWECVVMRDYGMGKYDSNSGS